MADSRGDWDRSPPCLPIDSEETCLDERRRGLHPRLLPKTGSATAAARLPAPSPAGATSTRDAGLLRGVAARARGQGLADLGGQGRADGGGGAWRDGLPESRTHELLEGVCDVDLDALDVELPRGFGRD